MINYIKYNKYLPRNNAVKGDDVLKNDNFQIEKVTCSSQLGYKLKSQKSNLYLKIEKNANLILTDDRNDCQRTMWRIQYPPNESEKYLIFLSNSEMAEKRLTMNLDMNQSIEDGTLEELGKKWKPVKGMSQCGLLKSDFSVLGTCHFTQSVSVISPIC